ncbi:MAG: helix-turn-helix domain-containing protein [Lachnospiraceae bacterium]|nr:helix-turn-helix domain-containing protein [Lachnospiraceae bacterium]
MANYKAGDVIRLTRNAVGMTQEKLSDGICSVETLSRIENGRHKIKRDTYRKLMERMGRGIHDNCAVCMGRDMSLLEEYILFEDALVKREYDIAKRYLAHICEKISDSVVDRQYLKRVGALVDYELGEISAQAFLQQLQKAMEMTIPAYESYLWGEQRDNIYPYREQEILILMGMGIAYYDMGELDKDIIIYETIIRSLDAGYMDEKNAAELKLINLANLARPLGKLERYEEALAKAEEGLNMAVSRGYAHALVELMMQTAGNRLKLARRKEFVEKEQELLNSKKMMRQAYYIAAARKDKHNINLIKENIKYFFDEEIS